MEDYISQAKEYLSQRLSAEISFQNNLETLFDDYASKLVDISFASNINPDYFNFSYNDDIKDKTDALITDMLNDVIDYTETLSISTHTENEDRILAYINKDIDGNNFYGRAKERVEIYKKEIEGIISAGLLIGTSKLKIKQSIKIYRKMPYQNPIFREAIKLNKGKSEAIIEKGLHFGVGISNLSFNSINRLCRFTIGDSWQQNWYDEWGEKGAIGYNVITTSGACGDCSTNAGFHSDGNLPMYHLNCRCIAIPVFSKN